MKRISLFISFCLVLSVIFCACANPQSNNEEYYGGRPMNAEILSEIAESILNESTAKEEDTTDSDTSIKVHDGVYYWTKSGSVYHKWADCGHLKNSSDILSGNREDAILAGKQKLCSTCEERN